MFSPRLTRIIHYYYYRRRVPLIRSRSEGEGKGNKKTINIAYPRLHTLYVHARTTNNPFAFGTRVCATFAYARFCDRIARVHRGNRSVGGIGCTDGRAADRIPVQLRRHRCLCSAKAAYDHGTLPGARVINSSVSGFCDAINKNIIRDT